MEYLTSDLALLRGTSSKQSIYLSICRPQTLWVASLSLSSGVRGETVLPFSGGSGSSFGLIEPFQEVWVGTAPDQADVCKLRVRSISSSDGGVSGTLVVASHGEDLLPGQYLTFKLYYPLTPKQPRIDSSGTFYKDGDLTYSSQGNPNQNVYPVVVAGPHRAGFLQNGSWTITPNLDRSFSPIGATLVSFSAEALPSTGTVVSIDPVTGAGTIQFTSPGDRWIKYQVTDEHGSTQTSYRWYSVHSPLKGSADFPETSFRVDNYLDSLSSGKRCSITLHERGTLRDLPDGTLVILWQDPIDVSALPDQGSNFLTGYLVSDDSTHTFDEDVKTTTFNIVSPEQLLSFEFSFSLSLRMVQGTPSSWDEFSSDLTPLLAALHLLKWHSTVLEVCDVLIDFPNSDKISWAEFPQGSLFDMLSGFLSERSIRYRVLSDRGGRIHLSPKVQLLSDSARSTLDLLGEILPADLSGELSLGRNHLGTAPFSYVDGMVHSGTFDADGNPQASPVCATAPGTAYKNDGSFPITMSRQTFGSQEDANSLAGRLLSDAVQHLQTISWDLPGNWGPLLDVASFGVWSIDVTSDLTLRGVVATNSRLLLEEVSARVNVATGVVIYSPTFRFEAPPYQGVTTTCPGFPLLGGIDFDLPLPDELTSAVLSGGVSLYRKGVSQKTWEFLSSSSVEAIVLDPFWQSRQQSSSIGKAIFFVCGQGFVKRTVDGGKTFSDVSPGTPPNPFGDSPAPTASDLLWVRGEGSLFSEGTFIFTARWQAPSGEWRSWLAVTTDDGTSWSYIPVYGGTSSVQASSSSSDTTVSHSSSGTLLPFPSLNRAVFLWKTPTNAPGYLLLDTSSGVLLKEDYIFGGSLNGISFSADVLDSTRFAVTLTEEDGGQLLVVVFALTGTNFDSITQEASTVLFSYSSGYPESRCSTVCTDSSTIVSFVNKDADALDRGLCIVTSYNSGTITLTPGSPFLFHTGLISEISAVHSGGSTVHLYYNDDASGTFYGRTVTISGTSSSFGMAQTITDLSGGIALSAAALDGTTDVLVNSVNMIAVSLGTSSLTTGSPVLPFSSGTVDGTYLVSASTTSGYLCYRETSTGNLSYRSFSVSSLALSLGSPNSFPWTSGVQPKIGVLGGTLLLSASDASSGDVYKVSVEGSGGTSNFKALELSLGKTTGETVYLSGWDGTNLRLLGVVFSSGLVTSDASFGPVSETDLTSGVYSLIPLGAVGASDGDVILYGRIPTSGNPAQILQSIDGGMTTSVVEDSLGTERGIGLIDSGAEVIFIAVSGSATKVYVGDGLSTLALAGTSTLTGTPTSQGTAYSFIEDSVYLASETSGTPRIIRASNPFTSWVDITYDYPVSGVNALEVLDGI